MLLNKDLKILLAQNLLCFESLIFDTDKVLKLLDHFDECNFDQDTSTIIKNVLNTLNFRLCSYHQLINHNICSII